MKLLTATFAAAAALSTLTAMPAAAAEPVQLTISYGDLDVTSPAGAARLAQRIESRVESVCERPFMRDLKGMRDYQSCIDSARDVAAETLGQIGAARAG